MNVKKMLELFTLWQKDLHTESHMKITLSSNTTVSISAAWAYVKVPFNSIVDRTGLFANSSISSNSITIPKDGIYRLSGAGTSQNGAYFRIEVNDTVVESGGIQPNASYTSVPVPAIIRNLNSGDKVCMKICKSGSANPIVAGGYTQLLVEKIG